MSRDFLTLLTSGVVLATFLGAVADAGPTLGALEEDGADLGLLTVAGGADLGVFDIIGAVLGVLVRAGVLAFLADNGLGSWMLGNF